MRLELQVQLAFSATGLENKDRFSKSDPFLRVLKLREGGDWVPVLKTEVGMPVSLCPCIKLSGFGKPLAVPAGLSWQFVLPNAVWESAMGHG